MDLLRRLFTRRLKADCSALLPTLLAQAIALGLRPEDVENAREMLKYDEPVLCFDILANQFASYDLEISQEFYDLLARTGACLAVEPGSYAFNHELIRSRTHIPKPVRDALANVLSSLPQLR